MIDKGYECVFDMVREGAVFIILILKNNLEKEHYYLKNLH